MILWAGLLGMWFNYNNLERVLNMKQRNNDVKYVGEKFSLTAEFREQLEVKFPNVNIDSELLKMERWLAFNKPKKDYRRFIVNWLNRVPVAHKMDNDHSHKTTDHNSGYYSKLPDLFNSNAR